MMQKIMNFIKDEDGLELVEYAVMGALIVLAIATAIFLLRDNIADAFERIAGIVGDANE